MLRPSAPPLNEQIPLQTIGHNQQQAVRTKMMSMKHTYNDGTTTNAYASCPVPISTNSSSSCSSPPPYHEQPLLDDGYGYAVPAVPMSANGRPNNNNNTANDGCLTTLCRCRLLKNVGMFCIAFVQFCISSLLLAAGLWCLAESANFCPFFSALWTASLCIVTSLVGMVATTIGHTSTHWHVANLVLSLVSIVLTVAGAMVAQRNWRLVGLYRGIDHPIVRRDSLFCLLGEYDLARTKHALSQPEAYFKKCLFQVKLGITINTVQLMLTIFLAILFTVSAILCGRKMIIIAAKKR